jgi:hypothetical protein
MCDASDIPHFLLLSFSQILLSYRKSFIVPDSFAQFTNPRLFRSKLNIHQNNTSISGSSFSPRFLFLLCVKFYAKCCHLNSHPQTHIYISFQFKFSNSTPFRCFLLFASLLFSLCRCCMRVFVNTFLGSRSMFFSSLCCAVLCVSSVVVWRRMGSEEKNKKRGI